MLKPLLACATCALALALPVAPPAAGAERPDSDLWPLVEGYAWDELRQRGPGVTGELAELYRATPDPEDRRDLARAFYVLGWRSEEAEAALMADAESGHEGLRIQVGWALGRVSADDRVVEYLLGTLADGEQSPLVRDKAACALASDQIHLTDAQRVKLLERVIDLLESPDVWLRWQAVRVLEVQTGQRKGFAPRLPEEQRAAAVERWRRWLEEYRSQL